jgi:hypothetical protein
MAGWDSDDSQVTGGWWNTLAGIMQAAVMLGLVAAAFLATEPARWLEAQTGASRIVLPLALLLVLVGLGVFWKKRALQGSSPFYAVFFGILVAWVSLAVAGRVGLLRPVVLEHQEQKGVRILKVVVDVSDAILFEDEDGNRAGPRVLEQNAVVAAAEAICRHVERRVLGEAAPPRADFWAWLLNEGAVLVNWEPAPGPDRPTERPIVCQLYLLDGVSCRRVGEGKPLAKAFHEAVTGDALLESRPPGLPAEKMMQALSLPAGADTAILLLAAGDVNSSDERAAWRRDFKPGGTAVISVLLPSLPRSGYWKLRGARAKAEMLRVTPRTRVVWLTGPPAGGDDPWVDLFDDLHDLDGHDAAAWDVPRDLDQVRRSRFGAAQAANVRNKVERGVLAQINALIPSPAPRAPWLAAERAAVALLALGVVGFVLVGMVAVPRRTLALTINAPPPGRMPRAAFLVEGAVGLVLVVVAVYRLWPGDQWQQAGRPALAVWTFAAVWSALVLYPLLYKLGCSPRACALAILVALLLPAGVGLLVPGLPAWVGWTLLLPPGLIALSSLAPGTGPLPGGRVQAQADADEEPWALPERWCPVGTVLAVGSAVLFIGADPVRGSEVGRLGLAALFLFACLVALALPWIIDRLSALVRTIL